MSDQRPDPTLRFPDATDPRPEMDAPGQGIDARIDVEPATAPDEATDQQPTDRGESPIEVLLKEGPDAPDAADIDDPDRQL